MIEIQVEEHLTKCSIKLKELENVIFVYQNEYNNCFVITHHNNKSIISSLLTVLETKPITDKEQLKTIHDNYKRVNKKAFGNVNIIQQ